MLNDTYGPTLAQRCRRLAEISNDPVVIAGALRLAAQYDGEADTVGSSFALENLCAYLSNADR